MSSTQNDARLALVSDHRRQWRDCLYVYPVVSRRAGGLSIGVNVNLDQRCNFRCAYCQIDRSQPRPGIPVDIPRLQQELTLALQAAASGELWQEGRFTETPPDLRRVNDIAFSGDGEPTCLPNFDQIVQAAADVAGRIDLPEPVKLVVITNGTKLNSPQVQRALPILSANHGEIWAKLDAGTECYFQRVNRPGSDISLQEICDRLLTAAVAQPVVIQTLFMRIDDQPPSQDELNAYCLRVRWLLSNGAQIQLVQLHTIARPPATASVSTLPDDELDRIAEYVRSHLPDVPVQVYYGQDVPPQEHADEGDG